MLKRLLLQSSYWRASVELGTAQRFHSSRGWIQERGVDGQAQEDVLKPRAILTSKIKYCKIWNSSTEAKQVLRRVRSRQLSIIFVTAVPYLLQPNANQCIQRPMIGDEEFIISHY